MQNVLLVTYVIISVDKSKCELLLNLLNFVYNSGNSKLLIILYPIIIFKYKQ